MIYAPALNANTYLHFSWLNEKCAIRDYSRSPNAMPFEDRSKATSQVIALISHEAMIRNRELIPNVAYWHRTTMDLNEAAGPRLEQSDMKQAKSTTLSRSQP
jgi:hypothetical protein